MLRLALLIGLLSATQANAQAYCPARALPSAAQCATAMRVSVAIVGDVLLHRALQWRGYARGFDTIWGAAVPLLSAADLTIANLEGPAAAGILPGGQQGTDPGPVLDDDVYSGFPTFNYHPVVIEALQAAGVDVVTTANNHALDRGARGVDATRAALDAAGMGHVGTVARGAPVLSPLRLNTPVGALSLIACTFGTNGISDPHSQVPRCYDDQPAVLRLVAAEAQRGAGVLVLPHWGQEYVLEPDARQRRLARALVAAGAMAVVGTHPHVPQPWDMLGGPAGVAPVIYSTGNFVAAQPPLERATSILAWLDLCRGPRGPIVAGLGYVPLQMEFDGSDPSLTLPRDTMGPRAAAGRALLARLIPGFDLTDAATCQGAAPRRTSP